MTLRLSLLELPATWAGEGGTAQALARVDELLSEGPATDLVLLPEASLTGYVSPRGSFDLAPFAEPDDGPTARAIAALAQKHRVHLAAPLIERDGADLYNAFVIVGPDGARLARYRKRLPWYPETWATPGDAPYPLVRIGPADVTLAICFDVHFLEEDAPEILAKAELLLFPSAWVDDEPGDARAPLLGALARRHGLTIANANWGPGAVRVQGQGRSRVVYPTGESVEIEAGRSRLDAPHALR
jgi:predicted amidohydrolase